MIQKSITFIMAQLQMVSTNFQTHILVHLCQNASGTKWHKLCSIPVHHKWCSF